MNSIEALTLAVQQQIGRERAREWRVQVVEVLTEPDGQLRVRYEWDAPVKVLPKEARGAAVYVQRGDERFHDTGYKVSGVGFRPLLWLRQDDEPVPLELLPGEMLLLKAVVYAEGYLEMIARLNTSEVRRPYDLLTGACPSEEFEVPGEFLSQFDSSQSQAFKRLQGRLQYIWGPPGTGKTFTIAGRITVRASNGDRCLALAPSRNAADNVAVAVHHRMLSFLDPSEMRIYSWNQDPDPALRKQYPHLFRVADVRDDYNRRRSELRNEQNYERSIRFDNAGGEKSLSNEEKEIIAKELEDIYRPRFEGLRNRERQDIERLIEDAQVICASLHSFLYDGGYRELHVATVELDDARGRLEYSLSPREVFEKMTVPFHFTVVDEGSFAPLAALLNAVHRSVGPVLVCGDPLQLEPFISTPPGVRPEERFWFERSAFDPLSEEEREKALEDRSSKAIFLPIQRRMPAEIAEIVSQQFYRGVLKTAWTPPEWTVPEQLPAGHLLLLDPDEWMHLLQGNTSQRSFENTWNRSAQAVRCALQKLGSSKGAAVVTPFNAQVNQMRDVLLGPVPCHTVYTAQGREYPLVFFDPVTPRHGAVNMRTVNVAVTRASHTVVLVGRRLELITNRWLQPFVEAAIPWRP